MSTATGGRIHLRLASELRRFVAPSRRSGSFDVHRAAHATLGHVISSLGVPLTEVGGLRVDGTPVPAGQRPPGDCVVEVDPIRRPQRVPGWDGAFLLDVHLGALARRLRLIGVDTAYHNDADDETLVMRANTQRRLLLSQDRGLLHRRALWAGAYVRGDTPAHQLDDVLDRFDPPLAPWKRCVACNGMLVPVPKAEIADRLRPGTRRSYDDFAQCRDCGQVYWHGAHSGRLEQIVAAARAGLRDDNAAY